MDYAKSYLVELDRGVTLKGFIRSIIQRTGLQNLEGALSYSRMYDMKYIVLQRTQPLPEHMKDIPAASSFGTEFLMLVEPEITQDRRTQILTNQKVKKESQDYNERVYIDGLTYERFIIDVTERGAETVTPELIAQVKAELEGQK